MTNLPPTTPTRTQPEAATEVFTPYAQPVARPAANAPAAVPEPAAVPAAVPTAEPAAVPAPAASGAAAGARRDAPPQRVALVVVIGMSLLALAFIIMIFVNVSSASINALAVIAAPIAAMVAAYYGITLSIQQVKNERAEKDKALARADAADTASRETEVWSAQMESGLRVAMAKLNAAGVNTDEVTKAAGTPDDFF